jgi:hypothetical protein
MRTHSKINKNQTGYIRTALYDVTRIYTGTVLIYICLDIIVGKLKTDDEISRNGFANMTEAIKSL